MTSTVPTSSPRSCNGCGGVVEARDWYCRHCGRSLGQKWRGRRAAAKVVAIMFAILAWISVLVTTIIVIAVDVEVILGMGPLIVGLALAMIVPGFFLRSKRVLLLMMAHVAVCVGVFLMIVLLRLNQREAFVPTAIIGAVWTVLSFPLTVFLFWVRLPQHNPWACVKCGYLLVGLESNDCPECGTTFVRPDPAVSPPPTGPLEFVKH